MRHPMLEQRRQTRAIRQERRSTSWAIRHGQEIVPQAGMLCVPVGSPSTVTWTAVGHDSGPDSQRGIPQRRSNTRQPCARRLYAHRTP